MSYPMDSVLLPRNKDACPSPAPAGCWRLRAGHAVSLQPQAHGLLHIAQGRVWLTQGDGHDHVLAAGDSIALQPGRLAVLEPWAAPGAQDVAFAWDAAAPPVACATPAAGDWERSVARPLWDLGQALGVALRATGQLARGLARWALHRAVPGGARAVPQCRGG